MDHKFTSFLLSQKVIEYQSLTAVMNQQGVDEIPKSVKVGSRCPSLIRRNINYYDLTKHSA